MEYIRLSELTLSAVTGLDAIKRAPILDEETGLKCLRIQDISQKKEFLEWGNTKVSLSDLKKTKLRKNDILVARTGATVGVSYYVNEDLNSVFNNGTIRLRLDINKINPYLVYSLFQTKEFRTYIDNISCVATQPNLRINGLLKYLIPVFSTDIQTKITCVLLKYNKLIENNNKRIKLLEQMAEELYKEWFVRFRFPGYEKTIFVDGIPANFHLKRIKDLVTLFRGKGYSSSDIVSGSMTLLSMNNVRPFGGFLRDFSRPYSGEYKEIHILHDGDLIMCITDMTQERRVIGYVGLVTPCDKKMIACTHLIKLVPHKIDTLFLYSMFTFSGLSRDISMRSTGTNVLGLNADIIKKVKALIPEQSLIDMYVKKVKPMFESVKNLQLANENLIKQRDLLLPRLMFGKIDLEDKEVI